MQKTMEPVVAASNKIIPVRIIRKPLGKKRWVWIGALAVIVLVALGCMTYKWINSAAAKIETDKYQVVFAGNNQAWFGKLHLLSDGSYQLTDVFYYSGQSSTTAQRPNADAQSPELVKMGSELHGPTDQIVFPKDQVVFWENLRSDSKVVQAIAGYKKK